MLLPCELQIDGSVEGVRKGKTAAYDFASLFGGNGDLKERVEQIQR